MAIRLLEKLAQAEQEELLADLNYLNTAEIQSFCKRHLIPYKIAIETKDGVRKTTRDIDRKGIVLNRIRHFLQTGEILEQTCFPKAVVCFDPFPEAPTVEDRLYYGRYNKQNAKVNAILKNLTLREFEEGAVARMLARKFWTDGQAPTLRTFASAWVRASREHASPNPVWAFLSDRASGTVFSDWKKLRAQKAATVMKRLHQITNVVLE